MKRQQRGPDVHGDERERGGASDPTTDGQLVRCAMNLHLPRQNNEAKTETSEAGTRANPMTAAAVEDKGRSSGCGSGGGGGGDVGHVISDIRCLTLPVKAP